MPKSHGFLQFNTQASDFEEILESYRRGVPTTAFGVSFGVKCSVLSQLDGKILYIVKDVLEAEKTLKELNGLCSKQVAVLYEKEELLLTSKAKSKDADYKRIKGIIKAQTDADIIVATLPSVVGLFPTNLKILTLKKGEEYDINALEQVLTNLGYKRGDLCDGAGSFARRGDIFDIFPVGEQNPVRLDFFGDEIERIKVFEETSGKSVGNTDSVCIMPATEIFLSDEDITEISQAINDELKNYSGKKNERFKEFAEEVLVNLSTRNFSSTVSVLPFVKYFTTIDGAFDFDAVAYSEPKVLYEVLTAYYSEHKERFNALYQAGEVFSADICQLASPEEFIECINSKKQIAFQALTADIKFFNPLKIINAKTAPCPKYLGKYKDLFNDLRGWVNGDYSVYIYAGDIERADRISEDIAIEGLPLGTQITVTDKALPEGFILHTAKQVVIGSDDIYLKPKKTAVKTAKKSKAFFSAPVAGDFAVHEIHGIGKVIGNKKLSTGLGTKDYVAVSYRGGDILYVPVEQLDTLTRYVGGEKEPQLSKIGGKDFERVKQRVRENLKKLSFDLKALYAERSQKNGFVFEEDDMQDLFEYSFGYEDTPDQVIACREIREDMCSKKVMDRLVCGDVGFGKTEVALRAVFRAVCNGKQAVMLAPTTILAEQHYATAKARFENFAITVESLDRFKTKKQQTDILQRLKEGKIDFIVGTHRLLSSDVEFKDLGLLVLDEEQRFGVEHKEKIKTLKNNVDAITLTATPIPRTLHMSLAGIRDISTINTPPKERLPVQTYVTEETDALITDAVRRELVRGGQVFILFNRVERIYHFASKVKELVPDAKVSVAHGQMEERALENTVTEFFRGESDVLIATTIIENGIDLPKANTIIVIDADQLGLSTLYQLRGRVGRSNRLAHAYFTFKREKVLTDTAYKRLSALMEFTEMGSGFKIAMRDLEIRGAGDILGASQHGHMEKVGYELYSKLLKEELEGKTEDGYIDMDIKLGAYIPDDYIENSNGRMDAYKQIAELTTIGEGDEILSSLEEVYGKPPLATVNLVKIAVAKRLLLTLNACRFYMDGDKAIFGFKNLKALENRKLFDAISQEKRASVSMSDGVAIKMEVSGLSQTDALDKVIEFLTLATAKDAVFGD